MVELQGDIVRYLPRNLSYCGNFPSALHCAKLQEAFLRRRPGRENSACCSIISRTGASTAGRLTCKCTCKRDGMQTARATNGTAESVDRNSHSTLVPSRAECEAMREMSIVSDSDTNYSEDYTRMTDTSTSTVSEHLDSDVNTPTGSICSDLDGSIDCNSFQTYEDDEQTDVELSQSSEPVKSPVMLTLTNIDALSPETFAERPPQPNSPDLEPKKYGSAGFEDAEFEYLHTEPVRRSSSLKTYKTPPGTPRRKKAVRFADALGLDLESVRHILNLDAPPEIPASAVKDLKSGVQEFKATEGNRYLTASFMQPGAEPDFIKRVLAEYVCLENCMIDDKSLTVTGTIRVANVSFHKYVTVRYTTDNWMNTRDICASYVLNSNDGATDRFSFQLGIPKYFGVGNKLDFAIRFAVTGQEYWDNNRGKNYTIECYARSVPTRDSDTEWIHFL